MFETFWPKRRDQIKIVESNIERHTRLLGENITFEHIKEAHENRMKSFAEFQDAQVHRATQRFRALETAICPRMYNDKLDLLSSRTCPGTAKWLEKDATFCEWIDMSSQLTKLLWLCGIPGAGEYQA